MANLIGNIGGLLPMLLKMPTGGLCAAGILALSLSGAAVAWPAYAALGVIAVADIVGKAVSQKKNTNPKIVITGTNDNPDIKVEE